METDGGGQMETTGGGAPPIDYVRVCVEGLQSPAARENKLLVKALTRLVPLVTRGAPDRMSGLLGLFSHVSRNVLNCQCRSREPRLITRVTAMLT